MAMNPTLSQTKIGFERPAEDTLLLRLSGSWKVAEGLPPVSDVLGQVEADPGTRRIAFDTGGIAGWDSGLLTFLVKLVNECAKLKVDVDREGLPKGVTGLLALAFAVPERKGARRSATQTTFLHKVGDATMATGRSTVDTLGFIGESFLVLIKLFRGKARYRRSDLFLVVQEVGAQALPIVTLISLLVGLIFAFIGSIQLQMFGAEVYTADLVGIAMIRAMGPLMTGIIMAGRTGAAFAAQLGTMEVNEEIDALRTLGVSPMEFLVLPRMLALALMMPLLCLYSDLMGILGGMVVGVGVLDLNVTEYYNHTREAVGLNDLGVGLFMGAVFGVLIAISGCLRGMQCSRSASAVGIATTSAVVTSIVGIIVATAIITIIVTVLGI
jgi:phospholipid/cholesterol/gamma-HCH transport system permease protein